MFVVDYVGNTEPQSYIDNIEAGHAMLDAARAATNVSYTQTSTPVGFFGYSQEVAPPALEAPSTRSTPRTSTSPRHTSVDPRWT